MTRAPHVRIWPPVDIGRTTTREEEIQIAREAPYGGVLGSYASRAPAEEHLAELISAGVPARITSGVATKLKVSLSAEEKKLMTKLGVLELPKQYFHVVKGKRRGSVYSPYGRRRSVRVRSYRRRALQ